MPRKKSGERSVKRDKKTSQLLERGDTPPADETVDPGVDSPSEITSKGGPANDASYSLNRGEGYSTLGGGVYPDEGAPEDAPRQGDWARHSTGGTSGARGREGMAQSEAGTWGADQSRRERRQEQRGGAAAGGGGAGGPRVRRKTDDSLAREIHEILTADPELDATDVEVVVEGGAVTLSGEVEHPDAKLLAEELTESVSGVRLVHNRLVVRR
jgi:osmotically-inducible protein OsmY